MGALFATERLREAMAALRAEGATDPVLLNALAAVGGELVAKIAAPEFEARLARDFAQRVLAHARR